MSIRHRRLGFTLAGLLAILGGAIVSAGAEEPTLVGRWREVIETARLDGPARFGTIEILPCGTRLCAISVAENGDCGDVVMRLILDARPLTIRDQPARRRFTGSMSHDDKPATIHGELTGDSFRFSAFSGNFSPMSRRAMPVYFGRFTRQGTATCVAPSV